MKKIAVRLFFLGLITSCVLFLYSNYSYIFIEKIEGPSTKNQIKKSFDNALKKEYNLLVLGNSRIYRGINPDKMTIPCYNFSHDNDSYNQLYYKLCYLKKNNKKFNYLVLGIDYFMFSFLSDTRNYVYKELFDPKYMNDYKIEEDGHFKFMDRQNNHFATCLTLNFSNTFVPFLRGLFYTITNKTSPPVPYLKENGQYIKPGQAFSDDWAAKTAYTILPLQKKYFEKILNHAKENSIIVFLVMPPIRPNELKSYPPEIVNQMDGFFKSRTENNFFYFNYSQHPNFKMGDYTDITHLNEHASDRFSGILNEDIVKNYTAVQIHKSGTMSR